MTVRGRGFSRVAIGAAALPLIAIGALLNLLGT